jgi:hypothetical protein
MARDRSVLVSVEDFSGGMLSSPAPENLPENASPDARNLIVRDPGKAKSCLGWVPVGNIGITGRIMHTGDFHPRPGERWSPSVLVPDTTDAAIFNLDNKWEDTSESEITLRNGYKLRVASGTIADSGTEDIIEISTDDGISWSSSATLTNGTGETQTITGGSIIQLLNGRIIYSVYTVGATKNVVATEYSTDNGATWSAQTHPNTSADAPTEELITHFYQIQGGTSVGKVLLSYMQSSVMEVHISSDLGDNWAAASADPGGALRMTKIFEARTGKELDTTDFSAVTAGTLWWRDTGGTFYKSTDGGDNWATATNINYPYGLYLAKMDREGLPGGCNIGEFYVIGDGRARTQLVLGNFAMPLGNAKPTTDPTIGTTSTGRTGTYKCYYTYYNSLTRQESGPSAGVSQEVTDENLTITPAASGSSDVDRIRFYIQKTSTETDSPEWATAYLAGEAADAAAAFTLVDTDVTILSRAIPLDGTIGGTAVPSYRIFERHQNRLIMAADVSYDTGSVSVTNDSATVTGSGTTWHVGMEGKYFRVKGDSRRYLVQAVASTTSITLATSFQGTTNANAGYDIEVDPTRLVFSHVLRPWALRDHMGQLMEIPFAGRISGVKSYTNDAVLVFTEDDTYLVTGTLSSGPTFNVVSLIEGVGCISQGSIVQVEDTVFWTSKQGFESWSHSRGYQRVSKGRVDDRFDSHQFGEDKAFCLHDPIAQEIHVFLTQDSDARSPDTRERFFYGRGKWMRGDFLGRMTAGRIARTSGDLPEVRLMYWDGTKARPMKLSRTVYAEGIGTGTLTGDVGSSTGNAPVTLTIDSGTLETDDDGLDGRYLVVQRASDGTTQVVEIGSNTGTVITAVAGTTWPTFTPASGDRWSIGGIQSQWETPDLQLGSQAGLMVTEVQLAFEVV